jgi:Na+-translocating ferredoxin:NAD+ oxidoreductase RnfD subunit
MTTPVQKAPRWLLAVSCIGLAWNLFGALQFFRTLTASSESLMARGASPEQIQVMVGLPFWMDMAFGWGVIGGLLGCCLLIARRRIAARVLLSSLVAYLVLFVGDITEGVFATFGTPQVVILSTVVLIAAGLYAVARRATTRQLLS